jgi:hypothetical protein
MGRKVMGLKETKIGDIIIVAQTTYYVYRSAEDRVADKFFVCTSDKKVISALKKKYNTVKSNE